MDDWIERYVHGGVRCAPLSTSIAGVAAGRRDDGDRSRAITEAGRHARSVIGSSDEDA